MNKTDTITVTECLGPNLKKLFLVMDMRFTIPTIAKIAIEVVRNGTLGVVLSIDMEADFREKGQEGVFVPFFSEREVY